MLLRWLPVILTGCGRLGFSSEPVTSGPNDPDASAVDMPDSDVSDAAPVDAKPFVGFDFASFQSCPTSQLTHNTRIGVMGNLAGNIVRDTTIPCSNGAIDLIKSEAASFRAASSLLWKTPITKTSTLQLAMHAELLIDPAGNADPADGVVFLFHSAPDQDRAIGLIFDFGFSGVTNSFGIEVDVYGDGPDPQNPQMPAQDSSNHVGCNFNGQEVSNSTAEAPIAMASTSARHYWLDYSDGNASFFISASATKPATPILICNNALASVGNTMWFGLTAGKGDFPRQQNTSLRSWSLEIVRP